MAIMTRTALTLAALFTGGVAAAQTPPDLRDLVGARAAGAENAMQSRGYRNVGGQTGDDRVWTYWWNERSRICVTVATRNGRYDSIRTSPAPDCQRGGPGGGGPRPDRPGQGDWDRPGQGGGWGQPGQRPGDDRLGLVCFGEGQRPALATRYGYSWNPDRDRFDFGNRTELTNQQFDASVMIQVWNGRGRIRLPRNLIPPLHSRGTQGWWDLTDVRVDRNSISAQYRLNGLNRPRINIDRRSGRISIRGTAGYAFRGTCDTVGRGNRF